MVIQTIKYTSVVTRVFFPKRSTCCRNVCARVSHGLPKRLIRLSNNRKIDCWPIVGQKAFPLPFIFSYIHNAICCVFYTRRFFSFCSPVHNLLHPTIRSIIVRAATFFSGSLLHTDGIPKRPRPWVARVVLFKDYTTNVLSAHTQHVYFVSKKTLQSVYTIGPGKSNDARA